MTDNEIIKALETLLELVLVEGCLQRAKTISKALDLINRQKAEIERLQKEIEKLEYYLDCECSMSADVGSMLIGEEKAKAEAIKEFAERLKKEIAIRTTHSKEQDRLVLFYIDNLVKEMVGETDEQK